MIAPRVPATAILIFGLTGCGGSGDTTTTTAPPNDSPSAPQSTSVPPTVTTPATPPSTVPTTTTIATTTTTTTTTTTAPRTVADLVPGLFCRDLNAAGFGYPDAVAYWVSEGEPDRMDADHNGIPCETVYSGPTSWRSGVLRCQQRRQWRVPGATSCRATLGSIPPRCRREAAPSDPDAVREQPPFQTACGSGSSSTLAHPGSFSTWPASRCRVLTTKADLRSETTTHRCARSPWIRRSRFTSCLAAGSTVSRRTNVGSIGAAMTPHARCGSM